MTVKKEVKKSTAKATSAALADESVALADAAKTPKTGGKTKPSATAKKLASPATAAKVKKADPKTEKTTPIAAPAKAAKKETGKLADKKIKAPVKTKVKSTALKDTKSEGAARVLDSKVVYEGKLFRVLQDHLIEPNGSESRRDVIRHNGSVVILAVDHDGAKPPKGKKKGKHKKNPWIVMERQYRHAAGQYLWELPAGKLELGEDPLVGAKRELAEETGYSADKWSSLVQYYASPGFLGEAMKVFLADGLTAGDAHPEEDEQIDFRLVRLSEILDMVDQGKIIDGKTLTSVLLYARQLGVKRGK